MSGRHAAFTGRIGPEHPSYAAAVHDDLSSDRPRSDYAQLDAMAGNQARRDWDELLDKGDPLALEILRRPWGRTPRHRTEDTPPPKSALDHHNRIV